MIKNILMLRVKEWRKLLSRWMGIIPVVVNTVDVDAHSFSSKRVGGWRVPQLTDPAYNAWLNRRINRYLKYQEKRMDKAILERRLNKATTIFEQLTKSKFFLIFSITKVYRDWYRLTDAKALGRMIKSIREIKSVWSVNPSYKRTYIEKANGKLRPLGVPSTTWRVYLFMINAYLSKVIDANIQGHQYGFRPSRNAWDAWKEIWSRFDDGQTHVFEFDLSGCFNKVSVNQALIGLTELGIPYRFNLFLERILTMPPMVKTKELQPENEIEIWDDEIVVKSGMPQGFATSPSLSIFVIDRAFRKAKLDPILYADDGILMAKEKFEISMAKVNILESHGLFFSRKLKKDGSKSLGFTNNLTFLGITWDIKRDCIKLGNFWKDRGQVKWLDIVKKVYSTGYGESQKQWKWEIHKNSLMMKNKEIWTLENLRNFLGWLLWINRFQRKGWIFVDSMIESSRCISKLIEVKSMYGRDRRRLELGVKFPCINKKERLEPLSRFEGFDWGHLPPPRRPGHMIPAMSNDIGWTKLRMRSIYIYRKGMSIWERCDQWERELLLKKLWDKPYSYNEVISDWRIINPTKVEIDWKKVNTKKWWPPDLRD